MLSNRELQEVLDDLDVFADRVYWLVQQVPRGRVATYGQIATYAGSPRAARAVGNLMRDSLRNGVELPWQRIINASGGISYKGDVARAELQRRLLIDEGVQLNHRNRCELDECRWQPSVAYWAEEAD
jgi:methylated-DNA-protein-cysteine methyltransferase-like protein